MIKIEGPEGVGLVYMIINQLNNNNNNNNNIYTRPHSNRGSMIEMNGINLIGIQDNARTGPFRPSNIEIIKDSKFQNYQNYQFRIIAQFGKHHVEGRVFVIIMYDLPSTVSAFKLNSETGPTGDNNNNSNHKNLYTQPHSNRVSQSRPKAEGRGPLTIEPRTEVLVCQRTTTATERTGPVM
jgi:hypothetical protein